MGVSYKKSLCPFVICPYSCSSDQSKRVRTKGVRASPNLRLVTGWRPVGNPCPKLAPRSPKVPKGHQETQTPFQPCPFCLAQILAPSWRILRICNSTLKYNNKKKNLKCQESLQSFVLVDFNIEVQLRENLQAHNVEMRIRNSLKAPSPKLATLNYNSAICVVSYTTL